MSHDVAEAKDRYIAARERATREDWLGRLTGRPTNLLPYEAIAGVLKSFEHRQLTELRPIPLDKIVGSVGRYRDFTRSFLPRRAIKRSRWVRVDVALNADGLPPIEVYQIGDVYFVADGNHRVSVARANGIKALDAYVTVVPGIIDLTPGDTLDQAIVKAECAHFLAQTRLGERCSSLDIDFTRPGGYAKLLEHIYAHLYFMKVHRAAQGQGEEPSIRFTEAARDWYDNVYVPILDSIREHKLTDRFPNRTASDLYVWVSARMLELSEQQGQTATAEQAVQALADEAPTPFLSAMRHLVDQLGHVVERIGRPEQEAR